MRSPLGGFGAGAMGGEIMGVAVYDKDVYMVGFGQSAGNSLWKNDTVAFQGEPKCYILQKYWRAARMFISPAQ